MKDKEKIVNKLLKNRAKILEDFCRAYLADNNIPINKIELVEENRENKIIWFFRIKRGRPKKT